MTRLRGILLGCILAIHSVLLLVAASTSSACYDEGPHIAAGLAYWQWGETSIYNLSPPPTRMWAALPAFLSHPNIPPAKPRHDDPPTSRHFVFFQHLQAANSGHISEFVLWGRLMQIPVSILLAIGIFSVARSMYGPTSGLVACALYCFSPTILANAATVGTDIWAAAAIFYATLLWIRFMQNPTNGNALAAGAVIALAHATKFTALILWPTILLIAAVEVLSKRRRVKECAVGVMLAMLMSYVALNASYGFRQFGRPLDRMRLQSSLLSTLAAKLPPSMPIPFAADLVEGFDAQKFETESKYARVLFDHAYIGSDWRYYPWRFLTGNTVGGILLALVTVLSFLKRRPSQDEIPFLLLFILIVTTVTTGASINIGRYLLPAYIPAAVLASRAMSIQRLKMIAIVLVVAGAAESMASITRLHSFVNVAAAHWRQQVPEQDWGQSLPELRRWEDQNSTNASLLYFGSVDPDEYEVKSQSAMTIRACEYVAISKEYLNGIPGRSRQGFVFVRTWRKLRAAAPVADLGGLLVYRREDAELADGRPWVVSLTTWAEAMREPEMLPVRGVKAE